MVMQQFCIMIMVLSLEAAHAENFHRIINLNKYKMIVIKNACKT